MQDINVIEEKTNYVLGYDGEHLAIFKKVGDDLQRIAKPTDEEFRLFFRPSVGYRMVSGMTWATVYYLVLSVLYSAWTWGKYFLWLAVVDEIQDTWVPHEMLRPFSGWVVQDVTRGVTEALHMATKQLVHQ